MQDNKSPISIMRWINYNDAGMTQFERSTQYIFKEKSSPVKYRGSYNLSVSNPSHGIEIIQNRWKPRGNRIFKHGVISFGVRNLAAEKAMEVTDEILMIYKAYPMLFAIHTDIPHRIHAHFIMGMTNVFTGKKFEQSQAEFDRFRDHYNRTLVRSGLPSLKGYEANRPDNFDAENVSLSDIQQEGEYIIAPQYYDTWTVPTYQQMVIQRDPVQSTDLNFNKIIDKYRDDFRIFYNLGRGWF